MSNSRTPFCKICFDAKKSASVYNSHYVRASMDPKSAITCPILLATECRYCHGFGHTISRCEVRERNNQKRATGEQATHHTYAPAAAQAAAPSAPAPAPAAKRPSSNNKFALLEEEEDQPVLCKPSGNSYATVANSLPTPPPRAVVIPPPVPRPAVVQQRQSVANAVQRPYLSRRDYEERERNTVETQRREALRREAEKREEERKEAEAERLEAQRRAQEAAKPRVRTAGELREIARIRACIKVNPECRFADPDEDW